MAYLYLARGELLGVVIAPSNHPTDKMLYYIRPLLSAGLHQERWRASDKRLAIIVKHLNSGHVTVLQRRQIIRVVYDCLTPGQKAAMTRWMGRGWMQVDS